MTETITITDAIAVNNRSQSRYAHIYDEIDRAIVERREIAFSEFADFKTALKLYESIRHHYRGIAYISFTKYGHNGAIQPAITVCGRRV